MIKWKEIAKFVSGLSTWEAIVHGSLWLSKTTPTIFGIMLTETLNIIQTIIPAIISVVLVYYAWFKK
jgi:hypothetical protein